MVRLFARRCLVAVAAGVMSEAGGVGLGTFLKVFARRYLDAVDTCVMSEAVMCVLTASVVWSGLRLFARRSLDAVATGVMLEAMMSFLKAVVVWLGLSVEGNAQEDTRKLKRRAVEKKVRKKGVARVVVVGGLCG